MDSKKGKAVKSIQNKDEGVMAQKVKNTNIRAKVKTKTGIKEAEIEEKVDKSRVKKTFNAAKNSKDKIFDSDENNFKRNVLIFVIVMFIGFTIYYAIGALSSKNNNDVDLVKEATVSVNSYDNNTLINNGSGFIYKKDSNYGYIVTSYYTVKDGNSFEVNLNNKDIKATLLGGDRYLNIAILSISKDYVKSVVKMGNSNKLKMGDSLFVAGMPNSNNKRLFITNGTFIDEGFVNIKVDNHHYAMNVIKSNNIVDRGDSGAPIYTEKGLIVGMVVSKVSDNNTTYSIPINDIKDNLYMFEKGNHIDRPYVGITVFNISDNYLIDKYNLSDKVNNNLSSGVVIVSVKGSSDSYNTLRRGDVIIKLEGVDTENIGVLRYELFKHSVGDKVKLTIDRNGDRQTVSVRLGEVKEKNQ